MRKKCFLLLLVVKMLRANTIKPEELISWNCQSDFALLLLPSSYNIQESLLTVFDLMVAVLLRRTTALICWLTTSFEKNFSKTFALVLWTISHFLFV